MFDFATTPPSGRFVGLIFPHLSRRFCSVSPAGFALINKDFGKAGGTALDDLSLKASGICVSLNAGLLDRTSLTPVSATFEEGIPQMDAWNLIVSFESLASHLSFSGYLDPGTGSYALQLLLAGVFGGLFALKQSWQQTRSWVTRVTLSRREAS